MNEAEAEVLAVTVETRTSTIFPLPLPTRSFLPTTGPYRNRIANNPNFKEITSRLEFMKNVGLDYLSLERKAATLSGGEAQRIRLATQIGSSLIGVLYILDEPSIDSISAIISA